jgi:hypothetical protein
LDDYGLNIDVDLETKAKELAWAVYMRNLVPDKESNHANNTVNTAITNTSSTGGEEFLAG